MGTRSAIGYQLPSGSINAVYCHWDGYPKHQVPILMEHYNSLEKVKALIKPGSMSSLRTDHTWTPSEVRDPQPLYHWERGNDGPWAVSNSDYGDLPHEMPSLESAKQYWNDNDCEYMYVFIPDLGWNHHPL